MLNKKSPKFYEEQKEQFRKDIDDSIKMGQAEKTGLEIQKLKIELQEIPKIRNRANWALVISAIATAATILTAILKKG